MTCFPWSLERHYYKRFLLYLSNLLLAMMRDTLNKLFMMNKCRYLTILTNSVVTRCLPQIYDNAGLLELPSKREANVRRAGGEPRSDTVGDGQPRVRGLRAAAAGHAAHQPGVIRRERPGEIRPVISRLSINQQHDATVSDVSRIVPAVPTVVYHPSAPPSSSSPPGPVDKFSEISGQESRISIFHDYYII